MDTRFLADSMLGRLARWLRALGYDAVYEEQPSRGDDAMAEQARAEGRVLLTRDRRIPARPGLRLLVLDSGSPERQLVQVLTALGLRPDPARRFTRCTVCNGVLERIPRAEGAAEAPPRVRELDTDFFRCPDCRKLYWMGTHTEATARRLKELGLE